MTNIQVARMPELMHRLCIQSWRKANTPQTSQGLYSGLASNVDVSIVVLIVFGGSGSKVTCLFAKIGIPSKAYATDGKQDKLAYDFLKFTSTT